MEENNNEKFEVRDTRHKEKFQIDDLYLNGYAKKCGIYATGVYVSLCRHANTAQICWPSQRKIAEELKISKKEVGRAIKKLQSYNIIEKIRVGKKLNNRYVLLDRSEWTGSPITGDHQSFHLRTSSPFHSKDTQLRNTNKKENFSSEDKLKLLKSYKQGNKKYKPFYKGEEMRWVRDKHKLYVIPKHGGEWLEFVEKNLYINEIEWK